MSYGPDQGDHYRTGHGGPAQPTPQPIMVQGPQTSGSAVASLVFGILGLVLGCCTFGIPSILAVLTGHVGLRETKTGQKAGRGMAIAGLILGYILVIPMIIFSVMVFFGAGLEALNPTPAHS